MRTAVATFCLLAAGLAGCGGIQITHNGGAADATAAEGLGEGPIGEVPTNGAFGPDFLSHDPHDR